MPRIFDNIDQQLLPALQETLGLSDRSDFCIGFFNLRGWEQIDSYIEQWAAVNAGATHNCWEGLKEPNFGLAKEQNHCKIKQFAMFHFALP